MSDCKTETSNKREEKKAAGSWGICLGCELLYVMGNQDIAEERPCRKCGGEITLFPASLVNELRAHPNGLSVFCDEVTRQTLAAFVTGLRAGVMVCHTRHMAMRLRQRAQAAVERAQLLRDLFARQQEQQEQEQDRRDR